MGSAFSSCNLSLNIRTLSMVYKKRCKKETSPFLSNFCWCHCSIYDVIASLLLNKASKIELVVSYKGVSYKPAYLYTQFFYKNITVAEIPNYLLNIVLRERSFCFHVFIKITKCSCSIRHYVTAQKWLFINLCRKNVKDKQNAFARGYARALEVLVAVVV